MPFPLTPKGGTPLRIKGLPPRGQKGYPFKDQKGTPWKSKGAPLSWSEGYPSAVKGGTLFGVKGVHSLMRGPRERWCGKCLRHIYRDLEEVVVAFFSGFDLYPFLVRISEIPLSERLVPAFAHQVWRIGDDGLSIHNFDVGCER